MNVQMDKKNKKKILQVTKLAQTKCQNLSMSKIDCLKLVGRIFSYQKSGTCNKLVVKMGDVF
jgi:flagellar biosynthesis protein FlhB